MENMPSKIYFYFLFLYFMHFNYFYAKQSNILMNSIEIRM